MNPKMRAPPWLAKAREFAARVAAPNGKTFSLKNEGNRARLDLYDEIGYDPWFDVGISAADIAKAVQEAAGADALDVHINSPGGYVFEGIAIFNAIRSFDGERKVYVDGVAASIASVIALAGDTVVTNEGAMWMIHEPAGGLYVRGNADDIEKEAGMVVRALRKVRENILDIYVTNTGQSLSQLAAWMAEESWMTADEAKARGFTDEVVKQEAAEPEEEPAAARQVVPVRALTPAEIVVSARAIRADLSKRFPGASPGPQHPGQPGTTKTTQPGNRQKEGTK